MKRGFRFQTGEFKDIANEIRKSNIPEVDIDSDKEYKELLCDLESEGIYAAEKDLDKKAINKVENPEFQYRTSFYIDNDKSKLGFIDFYTVDEPEETYADVFGD